MGKKRQRARAKVAAKRLPAHMQDIAFSKFSGKAERKRREKGTFGAAGPVRRIDPATGHVIATIASK